MKEDENVGGGIAGWGWIFRGKRIMGDRWLAVLEGIFFFFENRDGGKIWNECVGFLAEMCVSPLHVVLLTRDNVNVDLGGKVVGGGKAAHVHDYVLLLWTV